jgi:hypothetical protein
METQFLTSLTNQAVRSNGNLIGKHGNPGVTQSLAARFLSEVTTWFPLVEILH